MVNSYNVDFLKKSFKLFVTIEIVGEIAEDCPNWLNHFRVEFEEYLREREYIQ